MFRSIATSLMLALALSAGLTACGSILQSDAPPTTDWWLVPGTLTAPSSASAGPLVLSLTVVPGLDTDRILNLGDNAQLNSYAGARWPEPLPAVLESLVQRSLETVSDAPVRTGFRAGPDDCLLSLEVREFFGRVDQAGVTRDVQFALQGELLCPGFSHMVSSRQTIPVTDNRMSAIVAAFQKALDRGLQDLATQLNP